MCQEAGAPGTLFVLERDLTATQGRLSALLESMVETALCSSPKLRKCYETADRDTKLRLCLSIVRLEARLLSGCIRSALTTPSKSTLAESRQISISPISGPGCGRK